MHEGRGRIDVVLDSVSSKASSVINAVGGGDGPLMMGKSTDAEAGGSWMHVLMLVVLWIFAWVRALVTGKRDDRVMVIVNAACAHLRGKEVRGAVIVDLVDHYVGRIMHIASFLTAACSFLQTA